MKCVHGTSTGEKCPGCDYETERMKAEPTCANCWQCGACGGGVDYVAQERDELRKIIAEALRKRAAAALPENKNNRWVIELERAAELIERGELP